MNHEFPLQKIDSANRYDIVSQAVVNESCRHCTFYYFFTICDSYMHLSPKNTQLNFKVDSFFAHINNMSLAV